MGYHSTVSGELRIVPPLTAAELRQLPTGGVFGSVKVHVESDVRETPEGTHSIVTGVAIVPSDGDTYEFEHDIHMAVAACTAMGCDVSGVLYRKGEDRDDVTRVVVDNGKVQAQQKERLVWPDGTRVD